MISEDNVSRLKWLLAKVEEVHPGKDGLVRTATVKTQRGVLNRPVQRLHKLKVGSSSQENPEKEFSQHGGETSTKTENCCKPCKRESDVVPLVEDKVGKMFQPSIERDLVE